MVVRPKDAITVAAGASGARLIILGGATLGGPRYICWNFISSSQAKIDEANEQWRQGRWGQSSICRNFSPAQPNRSATSVRDYCSGF